MGIVAGERNFNDFRAESFGVAANGFERRKSGDEFFAGADERSSASVEDFTGTTTEDHFAGLDGMRLRDSFVKGFIGGVGIAIDELQGVLHRGDDLLRRAVGVFVAAEDDGAEKLAGAGGRDEFAEGDIGDGRESGGGNGSSSGVAKKISACDGHGVLAIQWS